MTTADRLVVLILENGPHILTIVKSTIHYSVGYSRIIKRKGKVKAGCISLLQYRLH
jgi:hypothetical protein